MNPDRRKMLKGMVVSMAAAGMSLVERRSAIAAKNDLVARPVGEALAKQLNDYFTGDQLKLTVANFKKTYPDTTSVYRFGRWLRGGKDADGKLYFKLQWPMGGWDEQRFYDFADKELEPICKVTIVAAVKQCLTGTDNRTNPMSISFICPEESNLTKHHVVGVSMSDTLCTIKVVCVQQQG